MNNPLNTNELQFWLRFNSLGHTNWYEIAEPIGFDGAKFVVEQEPNRFARSIKYGAIDKLRFVDTFEGLATTTQTINPQGNQSNHLDYGLQWLLYIFNKYGFELDVDFKITINGVDFKIYGLDANDKDITDGYTYFQCKLIDNSNVMDYKRRYDDKLNMFADKSVFGQTIAPLSTFNYLRRSTTLLNKSKWELSDPNFKAFARDLFTPSNRSVSSQITNSLVNFDFAISVLGPLSPGNPWLGRDNQGNATSNSAEGEGMRLIKATKKTTVTNILVEYDFRITELPDGIVPYNIPFDITYILIACYANEFNSILGNPSFFSDPRVTLVGQATSGSTIILNNYQIAQYLDVDLNINLEVGQNLYGFFSYVGNSDFYQFNALKSEVTVSASQTSLDSVIKAVRLVDLYKQSNLMFRNLPFYAPLLDVGGKYYNQAVFNKSTVSQRVDNMYTTFKDLTENLMECCQDVELLENEMFIDEYEKFYTNDEIGVYSQIPSEELSIDVNDRFAVNRLDLMYSKFGQDRDLINTNLSVHTQSQNRVENDKVENKKEIKVDFVRDPFEIQNIVDLEVKKPTTSTDNDDTLMLEEMVQLAPNSFGIIRAFLLIRIVNGKLEILNNDSGATGESDINWNTIGTSLGGLIELQNSGLATGFYTVSSLTQSVMILTPNFTLTTFAPINYSVTIKYFYTNVLWQTRTSQGFNLINGVGASFANLNFTIKRNFMRWFKYIASFVQYNQKDIINTYFKNNGALQTQLTTETTPVTENANILFSQLPTPILTGKIINLTVASDWQDEIDHLNKYELPNTSGVGSLRRKGFVRCLDLKGNVILGYVQNRSFNVSTNELNLTLEEKYSPQILKVDVIGNDLFVNDVRYNLSGNANWFQTQNNFIQFFDDQSRAICQLYEYNFVSLNNVTYNSIGNLVTALNALI